MDIIEGEPWVKLASFVVSLLFIAWHEWHTYKREKIQQFADKSVNNILAFQHCRESLQDCFTAARFAVVQATAIRGNTDLGGWNAACRPPFMSGV